MDTKQLARDLARLTEKVDILAGDRGGKAMTAVRRNDLQALASMTMKSKQISAAPTQADYNALQADVNTIMTALTRLSGLYGA